jgi:hypothetical protein
MLSKINQFFAILLKSFTSRSYYYDLSRAHLGFTIKFFILFSLMYSTLNAMYWYTKIASPISDVITSLPTTISTTIFPSDLVIYITQGQVMTNSERPVFISMDVLKQLVSEVGRQILGTQSDDLDYLMVIDPSATINDFVGLNTFALLTETAFLYLDPQTLSDNSNQVRIKAIPLAGITTIITQETLTTFLNQLIPFLKQILPFSLLVLFLLSLAIIPYLQLVYVLTLASLTWFMAKLLHMKFGYQSSFQVTLHAFCNLSLVAITLQMLGIYPSLPLLFTTVMVIIVILALTRIREITLTRRHSLKVG